MLAFSACDTLRRREAKNREFQLGYADAIADNDVAIATSASYLAGYFAGLDLVQPLED